MKNLLAACDKAMDAFEGGDIGVDEGYSAIIRDKIGCIVEEINELKIMAKDSQ